MDSLVQKSELKPKDHRDYGAELDLFYIDDDIGRGLPVWLPKGFAVRDALEQWMRGLEDEFGYARVASPVLAKPSLFERSGHLPYYADSMFPVMEAEDGEAYLLRPMNCPAHHRIFAHRPRSYRDLPLRLAEFGHVFRFEDSGALLGLSRARALCINDAHIYCRPDQLEAELASVLKLYRRALRELGIDDFELRLSKWDSAKKDKFVDQAEEWERCEEILRRALRAEGLPFEEAVGEAAFYGPKIDVQLRSVRGKAETISTIQLDFSGAERMGLEYRDRDGQMKRPYVLHRAPIGSFERMVAYLLEKYRGRLPLWLSPEVVRILPLKDSCEAQARTLASHLRREGVRASIEGSDDALAQRIKKAHTDGVALVVVLGEREIQQWQVSVRSLRDAGAVRSLSEATFLDSLVRHVKKRVNTDWRFPTAFE